MLVYYRMSYVSWLWLCIIILYYLNNLVQKEVNLGSLLVSLSRYIMLHLKAFNITGDGVYPNKYYFINSVNFSGEIAKSKNKLWDPKYSSPKSNIQSII